MIPAIPLSAYESSPQTATGGGNTKRDEPEVRHEVTYICIQHLA